jgi:hypothetical protein
MINFVQYLNRDVHIRKGLSFEIDAIPASLLQELDARRKIGVWWLQSGDSDSVFKVIGRSVIDRYKISKDFVFMDVDTSESYDCRSYLGDSVKIKLPELIIKSNNLLMIDNTVQSLISASVRNSSKRTLSKTIGYNPGRSNRNLSDNLIVRTRELFSETFKRSVNDLLFKRKIDTQDIISGAGITVLESLIKNYQIDPIDACDAVIACDPICRDIIHSSLPQNHLGSEIHPKIIYNYDELRKESLEPYFELNYNSLKARTYSDPLSFRDDMKATQRAENVHQSILKSIVDQLCRNNCIEIKYSKLADLAIFEAKSKVPLHLIEIKSATPDNIESQYSKGMIQLSRLRFLHGRTDIKLHLVAERTSVQYPPYLAHLASQLDVIIHQFDFKSSGLDTCQSLYKYINNSCEKSSNKCNGK